MREYLIEFVQKLWKAWWAVVGGFIVGAVRFVWVVVVTTPDGPRNLSIPVSTWVAWTAIGTVIAAFVAFVKVAKERDALKDIVKGGLSIAQQFRQIYDRMIALKDCSEQDFPAGPEAWRIESDSAAKRGETLLRQHFSPEEANQFRQLTWRDWKDHPEIDYGESDEDQRIALLLAQAKFLYPYATE